MFCLFRVQLPRRKGSFSCPWGAAVCKCGVLLLTLRCSPLWLGVPNPRPESRGNRDSARGAKAHFAPMAKGESSSLQEQFWMCHRRDWGWKGQRVPGTGQSRGTIPAGAAFPDFCLSATSQMSALPSQHMETFLTFLASPCSCSRGCCPYLLNQNPCGIWGGGRGREGSCAQQSWLVLVLLSTWSCWHRCAAPAPYSSCSGKCQQCWATLAALGAGDREGLSSLFCFSAQCERAASQPALPLPA